MRGRQYPGVQEFQFHYDDIALMSGLTEWFYTFRKLNMLLVTGVSPAVDPQGISV